MFDIGIIGGGISGLYTAYRLLQKNKLLSIMILEASDKLGGRISTIYGEDDISYEAGAARFSEYHTRLIKLLTDLDLLSNRIPISSSINVVICNPKYRDIQARYNNFDDIIKDLYKETVKRRISSSTLIELNLIDLINKTLGSDVAEYMATTYPYYSELKHLNALEALKLFKSEFTKSVQYYVLQNGLSSIITKLHQILASYPNVKILLKTPCLNIKRVILDDGVPGTRISYKNKTTDCRNLILACPKASLNKFNILRQVSHLLSSVSSQPLYRIYARYSKNIDGTYWFSNISKTITDLHAKYIIPYDLERGVIMISYTDSKYADYWMKLLSIGGNDAVLDELNRELHLVFPTIIIPEKPLWIKHYYWSAGAAYWKKCIHSDKLKHKIVEPLGSELPLYIVGENYSSHQAWIEGALETSDLAISKIKIH